MSMRACVRECVSACIPVHARGTLTPHWPIASADVKNLAMRLANARVCTRVANRLTSSGGQFATRVDSTAKHCCFARQHTCRKATDAQRWLIATSVDNTVAQYLFAHQQTCSKSTEAQHRLFCNLCRQYCKTLSLCKSTHVL